MFAVWRRYHSVLGAGCAVGSGPALAEAGWGLQVPQTGSAGLPQTASVEPAARLSSYIMYVAPTPTESQTSSPSAPGAEGDACPMPLFQGGGTEPLPTSRVLLQFSASGRV